ncbi:MAG: ADOP family duplicated permease [Gemmatimonadetes bacterium]|nr:ADOP family duplicated permease [Gemmatimonadota bacterium]
MDATDGRNGMEGKDRPRPTAPPLDGDAAVEDELRFHVQMLERELREEEGMDEEEARREARARFGDLRRVGRRVRRAGRGPLAGRLARWLGRGLSMDLKVVVRQLARSPGFTAAAVLTLALGIAADTVALTLLDGYFLRPLPYPAAERLVAIWETGRDSREPNTIAPANLQDWKAAVQGFESIAGYNIATASVTDPGEAARLPAAVVEPHFFQVLGVEPLLGPGFDPDARAGNQVVLSHGFWQRRLGGTADVVGRTVRISGAAHTVVGVMPPNFRQPERELALARPELWTALDPVALATDRRSNYLRAVGRLAPGVPVGAARRELEAVQARLAETYPEENAGRSVLVNPLAEEYLGEARAGVLLLGGAGLLVLLLVCGNLATLVLARAEARTREFAVRAALGSGRARLVRQVLAESLVLTLAGGVVGVALLAVLGEWVVGLQAARLSPLADVALGGRAVVLVLALALLTAVLAGLLPARRVAAADLRSTLRSGRRGSGGDSAARGALVVGELALPVVLLVAGGLLLRSFVALVSVPPGFDVEGVALVEVGLPATRYPDADAVRTFYGALTARAAALPGVQAVSLLSDPPFTGENRSQVVLPPETAPPTGGPPHAEYHVVGPDYFRALGMGLLAGRGFEPADGPDAPPVAVVNGVLAARLWPSEEPVGRTLLVGEDATPTTVVGVAPAVLDDGFDGSPETRLYLPFAQRPSRAMTLVARTRPGDEGRVGRAVRAEVAELDAELPVEVASLASLAAANTAAPRDALLMVAALALLAVVLAAVGVYGVMAGMVTARTREIGIRAALGADRGRVVREVLARSGRLVLWGGALGLAGAAVASRLVRGFLFGVGPTDPLTYAAALLMLATLGLAAAWAPARRAAGVDPMMAIQAE